TTTHRRGQRTLDGNDIILDHFQSFFWQPSISVVDLSRLLTGIDFHPVDLALAVVGLLHSGVDYNLHRRSHVDTDTITFDERDDRIIRYVQGVVGVGGNLFAALRDDNFLETHGELPCLVL